MVGTQPSFRNITGPYFFDNASNEQCGREPN